MSTTEDKEKKLALCGDCNNEVDADALEEVMPDHKVCSNCAMSYYTCTRCDNMSHEENGYFCDYCGDFFCENCNCGCQNEYDVPERGYSRKHFKGDTELAKVCVVDRVVGVEIEAYGGDVYELADSLTDDIGIGPDGSIDGDNGVEVKTPPASCNILEEMIDESTKQMKKHGFKVNQSCGLHIHIDCHDFYENEKKVKKLFNTYYAVDSVIFSILPKSRTNNYYCRELTHLVDNKNFEDLFRNINKNEKFALEKKVYKITNEGDIMYRRSQGWDEIRYHGVNLQTLLSQGHVELRYHNGTLNADKIKKWTAMNLHIVDWAINRYNKKSLARILNEKDSKKKVALFIKTFNFPKEISKYIKQRFKKFSKVEEDNND